MQHFWRYHLRFYEISTKKSYHYCEMSERNSSSGSSSWIGWKCAVCLVCWFVSLCEFVLAGLCMRINSFIAKCSKITIIPLIILFIRGQLFPGAAVFFCVLCCVALLLSTLYTVVFSLISFRLYEENIFRFYTFI